MIIRTQERPEPRSLERYENLKRYMAISDKMTAIGWRVDRERIREHMRKCRERAEAYSVKFVELSGLKSEALGKAGVGQTQAVKDWFLKTCEAPVLSQHKKTKKAQLNTAALVGYATDYSKTAFGPAAAALYALRKNRKYISYCTAYLALSADDGRVHSNFFPYGTKTGRWTSGARKRLVDNNGQTSTIGCNVQQVPQNEPAFDFGQGLVKLVESLRDCWIADDSCVVGSADFEALELREIAYIFGVTKMISAIDAGEDVHWTNARALFKELNLPEVYDEKNKLHKNARNGAKSCVYAMSYQYSEPGKDGKYPTLFKALKALFPTITESIVAIMAERFFALYPEIRDGQQAARETIDELGYREVAMSGRRIYYASSMRGYNSGINLTFQSTGAELIGKAILRIEPHCDWRIGGFYILAQVHDELCFNIPTDSVEHCSPIIINSMGAPAQFGSVTASIPAKLKVGHSWPK